MKDRIRLLSLAVFAAVAGTLFARDAGRSLLESLGIGLGILGVGGTLAGLPDRVGDFVSWIWSGGGIRDPKEMERIRRWDEARSLARSGAYEDQARLLEGIAGERLDWVRPNLDLGEVCVRELGDYERGARAFRRAADPPPDLPLTGEDEALRIEAKRRLAEIAGPDGALLPALVPRLLAEARRDLASGKTPNALVRLETAARLDPQSAEVEAALGFALKETGRYGDALQHLLSAAALDPRGTGPLYAAAEMLEEDENVEEEAAAWEEYLKRAGPAEPPDRVAHARGRLANLKARPPPRA